MIPIARILRYKYGVSASAVPNVLAQVRRYCAISKDQKVTENDYLKMINKL